MNISDELRGESISLFIQNHEVELFIARVSDKKNILFELLLSKL